MDDIGIERVGASDIVVDPDVGEDGRLARRYLRLQRGKAPVEVCDELFGALRLPHCGAHLADVGAHVVKRVFGVEPDHPNAQPLQHCSRRRRAEPSGQDQVRLRHQYFLGQAVIDRKLRCDVAQPKRGVHGLLRKIGH